MWWQTRYAALYLQFQNGIHLLASVIGTDHLTILSLLLLNDINILKITKAEVRVAAASYSNKYINSYTTLT